MGWANCGTDSKGRMIGYAHSATCDHSGCEVKIDRGLAYACGGMHGEQTKDGAECCEGYFCERHLTDSDKTKSLVCMTCAEKLEKEMRVEMSGKSNIEIENEKLQGLSPDDIEKLREMLPEIVETYEEVQEVINHFKNDPMWRRSHHISNILQKEQLDELLSKSQVRITFIEILAIATKFLALAEENKRLREFTEYALNQCSWDNDPDGGSIQDKAESLKLIELRPIDPEDAITDETEHYFCVWAPIVPEKETDKERGQDEEVS